MGSFITTPEIDKLGKITDQSSSYNPGKSASDRLAQIRRDFTTGDNIMHQGYEQFNYNGSNLNLIDYMGRMRMRFNSSPPTRSDDPDEEWRANTVRPLTRNKVISIVANVTSSLLFPTTIAQNEDDKEDKDMSLVMNDAIEWVVDNSGYEEMFLMAVQDMCVDPGTVMYQDFSKVTRKIKEIQDDGSWKFKEIEDEQYSGFQNMNVALDELYIGNVFEPDVQKQPFLLWRRVIDFSEAQRKYGGNKDFDKFVRPGLKIFYVDQEDAFFEQYDTSLEHRLVEELIYWNASADLELRIINGVLIDHHDRPMQRNDKKYPFAKQGFERYDSRFFYHMPLTAKLAGDQDVIDVLYNMIIDGTYLQLMPPIAVYGAEDVDGSILQPGMTTAFSDPSTRVDPLSVGSNLNAGLSVLQKVESSAAESSQDQRGSGLGGGGGETLGEVQILQANAKTVLGLFGKYVAFLVRDYGRLLVSSIVQHLPVGQLGEVVDGETFLKLPTLFLKEKEVDGKRQARRIEFTTDLPEAESKEELEELEEKASFKVQKQEIDEEMSIFQVNPEMFRRMKFLIKVDPSFIDKQTKFSKHIFAYDRMLQNPLVNQESNLRFNLVQPLFPGEEEKFIKEPEAAPLGPGTPGQPGAPPPQEGAPPPAAQGSNSSINNAPVESIA